MYTTFDLEVTVGSLCGRKASPFRADNFIVAIGYKREGAECLGSYNQKGIHDPDWFIKILEGTKLLVGQNIKFDLLWAMRDPRNHEAWMDWVTAGGKIWDCQLAEYLLRGQKQSAHMMALDDMVEAYGGNVKLDEVKAMWEAGYDTDAIPQDLLMRYLLGYKDGDKFIMGDIGNTEAVFLGQFAKAKKRGMLKCIMLNMFSLIASTEMERNGMYIDYQLGLKHAEELKAEIEILRRKMYDHLPKDLPFVFNWGSNKQLSALIFGGVITYEEKVPMFDEDTGEPVYFQADGTAYLVEDEFVERLGAELVIGQNGVTEERIEELKTAGCLVKFKSGKNAGLYKTKKVKVQDIARGQKLQNQEFAYKFDGFTKPKKEWETKHKGVYQVGAEIMEELEDSGVPFLDDLTFLNRKDKDLTTYYIVYDEKKQQSSGMLTLVDDYGIIHHNINHTSTVTGRFSSSKPNLQNVSGKDKSRVKQVFISRFLRRGLIIQSDFTSLEVYIQALLTGDKQLLADLAAGLDMHCQRVASKYKVEYAFVVEQVKLKVAEWVKRRKGAKSFSFQRAYGAGAAAIAKATKMILKDVEELIAVESARYCGVDKFYDQVTDDINATRVPTSIHVWHPEIKGLSVCLGEGYYRTPDGKKYTYMEQPAPAGSIRRGGPETSFSPPEIKNYIVQGTGAEWAKAAMWLAVRAFYRAKNFGGMALLVNQVHDAIYIDAERSVAREAAACLHAAMEMSSDYMEQRYDWEVKVPVPSETNFGRSMYREVTFRSPRFKTLVRKYKDEIRQIDLNGYVAIRDREAA